MKSKILLSMIYLSTIILAGCGQTGPLYLPRTPQKPKNQNIVTTQHVPIQKTTTHNTTLVPRTGAVNTTAVVN